MKIKVEYSESIMVSEGLWRKIGIEMESADSVVIDPQSLHNQAKEYVKKWHQEEAPISIYGGSTQFAEIQKPHNSVIDRSIERQLSNTVEALIKDIESCQDIKVLDSYRLLASKNEGILPVWEKKMKELIDKQ